MGDLRQECDLSFEKLQETLDAIRAVFLELRESLNEIFEEFANLAVEAKNSLEKNRTKYGKCDCWAVKEWTPDKRRKVFRCRNTC